MKKLVCLVLMLFAVSSSYAYTMECPKCDGSGVVMVYVTFPCSACGGRIKPCGMCNGRGRRRLGGYGMPTVDEVCVVCLGNGKHFCVKCCNTLTEGKNMRRSCPQCNGRGVVEVRD